jgi:TDG/mug DNA glycosylase family protein
MTVADEIAHLRLPRLIGPGLRLAFIGYNPGVESARQGHYYAHRGNVFWRQLHESGLTPRPATHLDDRRLFETEAIGFIDLCPRPTVQAAHLSPAEMADGARRLHVDLSEAQPLLAVFGGRGIFRIFAKEALGVPARALADREDGLQPERIGRTRLYVVPSSSGLASRWHRRRLELLEELAMILVMG